MFKLNIIKKFLMKIFIGLDLKLAVLYCGRVPAANAPWCTAAEGLFYKPWSLVIPTCSERRNYLGEKWPMNFAWKFPTST